MFNTPFTFLKASGGGVMPNPLYWWDSEVGVSGPPGNVTSWTDKQNSNAAIPNNVSYFSKAGTLNGYVGITNNSNDGYMVLSTEPNLSDFTVFGVFKNADLATVVNYFIGGAAGIGLGTNVDASVGGPGLIIYKDPTVLVAGSNLTTAQYSTYSANSSASQIRQNGTTVGTGAGITSALINKIFSGNGAFGFRGPIWEILVYDTVLSAGEITLVENYLYNKYFNIAPLSIQFNTSYYYTPTEAGLSPFSTDYYYNPNIE